ncbi:aldehyde-activating protein [Sphingopyxis sp. YF1]|uniref:GFA family protein n=1 Tax=Sphingopyxis sp. YF1 TaxID=2482763 RepID=UPI001F610E8F|nr:GFA family protein [Sphingopyxis sp. YF1]UNU43568.1 aldehyde-activating protein [Sphingopyxis sp. YF1]
MTELSALAGRCLCDSVRYTVRPGFRMRPYACHCHDCQRRSGSAFGIQLGVAEADLVVEGEVIEGRHVQPSGAVAGIFACPVCLTRLWTTNDQRPGFANLRAGTLDNSPEIEPAAHFWIRSKQPWIVLPEDVVALDTQPQSPDEWMRLLGPQGE